MIFGGADPPKYKEKYLYMQYLRKLWSFKHKCYTCNISRLTKLYSLVNISKTIDIKIFVYSIMSIHCSYKKNTAD